MKSKMLKQYPPRQLSPIPEDVLTNRAFIASVRLLSYRPRTEFEIRKRLSKKFPSHISEKVICRLVEQELIDDYSFALFWLRNCETTRPRGTILVRQELIHMGVEKSIVDQVLACTNEEASALHAATAALRKLGHVEGAKGFARLMGYLNRRGFGYSISRDAIRNVLSDLSYSA